MIGIDGGGTKTAAELCDEHGVALSRADGGPSNFQVIGTERAAKTIVDLIDTCCHSVGCTTGRIDSVVAGLTGAGRPADQRSMQRAIRKEASRRGKRLARVSVESDARIALEAAFSGAPGVIVIAGTGSIVFGKDSRGNVHRSGGWGRIIGDEGSGYAIGRELFRAIAAVLDGRSRRTTLAALLARSTGLRTQADIIRALYKEGFDVASVAPLVTKAAARRDPIAKDILRSAARDLVGIIAPVAKALAPRRPVRSPVPVVFVGSVLTGDNAFSAAVRRGLRAELPYVRLSHPDAPPVHGASLMALASL